MSEGMRSKAIVNHDSHHLHTWRRLNIFCYQVRLDPDMTAYCSDILLLLF